MRGESIGSATFDLDSIVDTTNVCYAEARASLCHEPGGFDHPAAAGKGTELPFEMPRGAELVRAVREGRISRHLLPEPLEEADEPVSEFICGDCGYENCNCRTSRY